MVFQLYFQLQLMSSSGVYVCLLVMSILERLMVPWQNIQQHSGYEVSVFQAWTELKKHRVPTVREKSGENEFLSKSGNFEIGQ